MIVTLYLNEEESAYVKRLCGRRKWGEATAIKEVLNAHRLSEAVAGTEDTDEHPLQ